MDYVIHINNGNETVKPIVLRLLPGEETIFNLKVINHGEPSNISLEASDPVFKAVRLKKRDRYVVLEEIVPIMARMPTDTARLDGEIFLTSSAGKSKVPISLLREPEDPGDDLDDPGVIGDPDLKDDLQSDLSNLAKEGIEDNSEEKGEEEEDAEGEDDFEKTEQNLKSDYEDDERDVRRIEFSRDRDLQRYKSASRPVNIGRNPEERAEERTEASIEKRGDGQIEGHIEERTVSLISPPGHQRDHQEFRQDPGYMNREYPREVSPEMVEEEQGYQKQGGIFDNFDGWGTLQIIPAVILLILISVLVLTFITESIPVFPGALASSILIVTLIIYGAATLLKA